ncbi:unnamed protein product, partial [Ectocarpus fasciculatus]
WRRRRQRRRRRRQQPSIIPLRLRQRRHGPREGRRRPAGHRGSLRFGCFRRRWRRFRAGRVRGDPAVDGDAGIEEGGGVSGLVAVRWDVVRGVGVRRATDGVRARR